MAADAQEVHRVNTELVPGGAAIAVTDANKREYVDAMINWRFCNGVRQQTDRFMQGFTSFVPRVREREERGKGEMEQKEKK